MNIAILGGTFDPPHFGHVLVARQVLEVKPEIDSVVLIPANTNPDKQVFASVPDRLAMTKLLVEPNISISDLDIRRGGETYTIDTVSDLIKDKKNNYFLILGSDLLLNIHKWQHYSEIISSIPVIIFPRPDYPISTINERFTILPQNQLLAANYSSTLIRKRIAKGLSIKGLVPEKVADYINLHQLYRSTSTYA